MTLMVLLLVTLVLVGAIVSCSSTLSNEVIRLRGEVAMAEKALDLCIQRAERAETALELAMCDLMNMDLSRYQVKDAMLARAKGKTP